MSNPPHTSPDDPETSLADVLVEEKFRIVSHDLPFFYGAVIAMLLAATALLWPHTPTERLVAWHGLCLLLTSLRLAHWVALRRKRATLTLAFRRKKLEQVNSIAIAMTAMYCATGYLVTYANDATVQMISMMTIWASGVGAAAFLFVLPRAARNVIIGTTAVVIATLLVIGRREFVIASPLYAVGAAAMIGLVRRHFETFESAIEARVEIERMRRAANDLAMTDALTALANRRAFDERLAMLCAEPKPFAVALIDLDAFKPVNDTFGHVTGDHVLTQVAGRMRALMPRVFTARLGGDEFALLIEDVEAAPRIAREAARVLAEPYAVDGQEIVIGASCGVAFRMNPQDADARALVERADAALYRAKGGADRAGAFRVSVAIAA
jgi:diguanylate cyclase (GGDEF)-like protein